MKAAARLAPLALAALLLLSLAIEARRYGAQIELARCQNTLMAATDEPDGAGRRQDLLELRERLLRVRKTLRWDPRPSFLLGSDALLRGEGAEALLRYQDSFAVEERPETDLNLSRAATLAGDPQRAAAWALRAAWLSPALVPELPPESRAAVADLVAQLERELAAGSASAIPGLP